MSHYSPYQTTFLDRFIVTALVVSAIFIALATFGCNKEKAYTDNTPAIQKKTEAAATQAADMGDKMRSAEGNIKKAEEAIANGKTKVENANKIIKSHDLSDVITLLGNALGFTGEGRKQLRELQEENGRLVAALTDNANAMGEQATANASLVADYSDLKTKWDAQQDDWLGPAFWRLVHRVTLTTFIIVGVIVITVGVLGVMYGADKVTKPIAGIAGTVLGWAQYLFYNLGTFILSAIPVIGHWFDEWAYAVKQKKTAAAESQKPAVTT